MDRCRRGCSHHEHGHNPCRVRNCKCWPVIELQRTKSTGSGKLHPVGVIRIDLGNRSYDGGYYERFDTTGKLVSWGSVATMLGSDLNWRKILSKE